MTDIKTDPVIPKPRNICISHATMSTEARPKNLWKLLAKKSKKQQMRLRVVSKEKRAKAELVATRENIHPSMREDWDRKEWDREEQDILHSMEELQKRLDSLRNNFNGERVLTPKRRPSQKSTRSSRGIAASRERDFESLQSAMEATSAKQVGHATADPRKMIDMDLRSTTGSDPAPVPRTPCTRHVPWNIRKSILSVVSVRSRLSRAKESDRGSRYTARRRNSKVSTATGCLPERPRPVFVEQVVTDLQVADGRVGKEIFQDCADNNLDGCNRSYGLFTRGTLLEDDKAKYLDNCSVNDYNCGESMPGSIPRAKTSVHNQSHKSVKSLGRLSMEEEVAHGNKASFWSSFLTLVMSNLGLGILSLPYAFTRGGIIPSIVITIICGILSDKTLCMLMRAVADSKGKSITMEELCEKYFGLAGQKLCIWNTMINLFLCTVSLFSVFMETWGRISKDNDKQGLLREMLNCGVTECAGISKVTVGLLGLGLIFPVFLQRSLHNIRHASTIAAVCLVVSLGMYFYLILQNLAEHGVHQNVQLFGTPLGICSVIGSLVTAYLCHFNILQVYFEADKPEEIYKVTHYTMLGVCMPLNILVGLSGYLVFGGDVEPNIFDSMSSSAGKVAAFIIALTSIFKLPLVFNPFRDCFFTELNLKEGYWCTRTLLYFFLALLAFVVAIFVNLADVAALSGAVTGTLMAFIIPGACYVAYVNAQLKEQLPLSKREITQTVDSNEPSSTDVSASKSLRGYKLLQALLKADRKKVLHGLFFIGFGISAGTAGFVVNLINIVKSN